MLTEWQVGLLDDEGLFHTFSTNRSDIAGDLMSRYRVVSTFAYSWWKDRFDLIPFEMPHRITLEEVQELYQVSEVTRLGLEMRKGDSVLVKKTKLTSSYLETRKGDYVSLALSTERKRSR
jgi:hypothetical protein